MKIIKKSWISCPRLFYYKEHICTFILVYSESRPSPCEFILSRKRWLSTRSCCNHIIKRSESECSHSSKRAQIAPRAQILICRGAAPKAIGFEARKEYCEWERTPVYAKINYKRGAKRRIPFLYIHSSGVNLAFSRSISVQLSRVLINPSYASATALVLYIHTAHS